MLRHVAESKFFAGDVSSKGVDLLGGSKWAFRCTKNNINSIKLKLGRSSCIISLLLIVIGCVILRNVIITAQVSILLDFVGFH
jgi:hypothetical protein